MLCIKERNLIVERDDYSIVHNSNGIDELRIELSPESECYAFLEEGVTIIHETTEDQSYVVSKISTIGSRAEIVCRLDLSDWQRDLLYPIVYLKNQTGSEADVINRVLAIKPGFSHTLTECAMLERIMESEGLSNWIVINQVRTHYTHAIEMDGPTPLEAALQLQSTFGCALRFNTGAKTVKIFYPAQIIMSDAYAIESVNLREPPEYKGRSTECYNRIYPIGAEGLSIASVNDGVPYLDSHGLSPGRTAICRLWRDERYTDPTALKAAAQIKIDNAYRPPRTWKLNIVDLQRIDPEQWPELNLSIWTRFRLMDRFHFNRWENVQVVEDQIWPYYPERNKITISNGIPNLQQTAVQTVQALTNTNSNLWGMIRAAVINSNSGTNGTNVIGAGESEDFLLQNN